MGSFCPNASIIHTISESYGIPGDLFKKISRKVDNVSISDSYWLSNFQMDNPNCPQNLLNLILAHFQELFPFFSKTNNKKFLKCKRNNHFKDKKYKNAN